MAEEVLNWSGLPVIHLRPTLFLEWFLYPWQLPFLQKGILRMPVGKGRHAMADYQTGHVSGAENNVEKLTGRRSMTVGEFARAHADVLNAKPPTGNQTQ